MIYNMLYDMSGEFAPGNSHLENDPHTDTYVHSHGRAHKYTLHLASKFRRTSIKHISSWRFRQQTFILIYTSYCKE